MSVCTKPPFSAGKNGPQIDKDLTIFPFQYTAPATPSLISRSR